MEIRTSSKRLPDLKANLLRQRAHLLLELGGSEMSIDEDRTAYSNHMAEGATEVFEQARNVGMRRSREHMLTDVEEALQRIEDGSYGVCRRCGQPIDVARLTVMPAAEYCYSCQEHAETR